MNAPWGLRSRLKLVKFAQDFFHLDKLPASYATLGRQPPSGAPMPLTVFDFLKYLDIKQAYPKRPNGFRVALLLRHLADHELLVHVSHAKQSLGGLHDRYLYVPSIINSDRHAFRLLPALGPELLYELCSRALVHITGKSKCGNEVSGTGIVVDAHHILTCRHVVRDMDVDAEQTFQGNTYLIEDSSIQAHADLDVAVLRIPDAPLTPVPGAFFQRPVVGQQVYTLGFPKLPGLRDASVTMQQGTVTNPAVTALSGEPLFLYSAISRPGNSGGPIVSADGYVVGLCVVGSTADYGDDEPFSPHYAGIPGHHVVDAVGDLDLGIDLPVEELE